MYRSVLVVLAALLSAGDVKAHDSKAADWLESYVAITGCPDASVFRAAVQQRLAEPSSLAFAGLRLGVDIRPDAKGEPGLIGRLSTDAAGAVTTRTLKASSCSELVEALSLVATLSAQAGRGGPRGVAPLTAPRSAEQRLDPEPWEPRDGGAAAAEASPEALQIGPAAFLLLQNAATPRFELGAGLGFSMSWPARGEWSPWLQVAGYRIQSAQVPIEGGRARAELDLLAAHVVGCPIRIAVERAGSLQPCLDLDLGRLRGAGAGSAVSRGSAHSGWWASTGLAIRAEVAPWGPLRLSALWGAVVPWTRHEFFFSPDTVAFRVPPIGWRGVLSAAMVF